jgi:hypothetical protein
MDVLVISTAAIAVIILIVVGTFLFACWRRNQYRIGLRNTLLQFALLSCATYVITNHVVPNIMRRLAIENIYSGGGAVLFRDDYKPDSGQIYSGDQSNAWGAVMIVHARNDAEATAIAGQLKRLPEVETLFLGRVSDKGLAALSDAGAGAGVNTINLLVSPVTADGLSQLARFNQLRTLFINTCPIDDASLAGLKRIESLRELTLLEEGARGNPNRFTEAGYEAVSKLDQLEVLWLAQLRISPASANHLKHMTRLKRLRVSRYAKIGIGPKQTPDLNLVSDNTIAELRQSLPNCTIEVFPRTPESAETK